MMDTEQARSTGLHEMQHQVQDKSGWQPGANPNSIFAAKNAGAKKMEQVRMIKEAEMRDAEQQSHISSTAHEVRDAMDTEMLDFDKALSSVLHNQNHAGEAIDYVPGGRHYDIVRKMAMGNDARDLQAQRVADWREFVKRQADHDALPAPITKKEAHAIYERSYGETEARVVQHRRNLTPEQRRQQFPMDDYKIESPRGMLTEDEVYDPMKRIMP
jgi:hypothetical protein